MSDLVGKWLPVTRHLADAVPAAVLRRIVDYERQIMPAGMRQHLADLQREAEAWHERQGKTAAGPRPPAVNERSAPAPTDDPALILASAVLPDKSTHKPMPWKNPRIKRRLIPGRLKNAA